MKTRTNGVSSMEPGDVPVNSEMAIVEGDSLWYWIGLGAGWVSRLFSNSTRNVYDGSMLINAA
jgi:hypothetical protein